MHLIVDQQRSLSPRLDERRFAKATIQQKVRDDVIDHEKRRRGRNAVRRLGGVAHCWRIGSGGDSLAATRASSMHQASPVIARRRTISVLDLALDVNGNDGSSSSCSSDNGSGNRHSIDDVNRPQPKGSSSMPRATKAKTAVVRRKRSKSCTVSRPRTSETANDRLAKAEASTTTPSATPLASKDARTHGATPSQVPCTAKKQVRWHTRVQKRRHHRTQDMTKDEIKAVWYDREDVQQIVESAKATVVRTKRGGRCDDVEHCIRGLEIGKRELKAKANEIRSKLMAEQQSMRQSGQIDRQRLASFYRELSKECSQTARKRALDDEYEALRLQTDSGHSASGRAFLMDSDIASMHVRPFE